MSFLNPVSESVLRFKSTDAGAPQINHNSRAAGDIKAILKACLVTGYGAKASAGWSIDNEVGHVAEFVSPNAAMSDYKLGVDDMTAAKTDWYYQYLGSKINPTNSSPIKSFKNIDKVNEGNGWELLVTAFGIVFVEMVHHSGIGKMSARITCWSQTQTSLTAVPDHNMCFFVAGHDNGQPNPTYFYVANSTHIAISGQASPVFFSATPFSTTKPAHIYGATNIDLTSELYITNSDASAVIGRLPCLLAQMVSNESSLYDLKESSLEGRPVLVVCAGFSTTLVGLVKSYARMFLIPLDYWEY